MSKINTTKFYEEYNQYIKNQMETAEMLKIQLDPVKLMDEAREFAMKAASEEAAPAPAPAPSKTKKASTGAAAPVKTRREAINEWASKKFTAEERKEYGEKMAIARQQTKEYFANHRANGGEFVSKKVYAEKVMEFFKAL